MVTCLRSQFNQFEFSDGISANHTTRVYSLQAQSDDRFDQSTSICNPRGQPAIHVALVRLNLYMGFRDEDDESRPELLSKYNVILTQTHSLMLSVSQAASTNPATGRRMKNPLPSVVIHPAQPVSEGQIDNALSSLLRMMRLPEVLDSDKRMVAAMSGSNALDPKTDEQIIAIMDAIRKEHDSRVERANMAVRMLAEKYNWRRRVGDGTINDDEGPTDVAATSVSAGAEDDTIEGDDALGPMFESDEDEENEMEPVGNKI